MSAETESPCEPSGKYRRLGLMLLGTLAICLAVSGVAYAFWTTHGAGSASVVTGSLNAPTNVHATSSAPGSASVDWTATSGTPGAEGYNVVRTNTSTDATANVCGTPVTPVTTTSCTDTGVAAGTYTYRVTAVYHSWTAQGAASNSVTIAVATKLAFTTQPSTSATSGIAFTAQPVVKVQDANGNTVTSDTSVVTLALTSPGGATLTCTGGNAVTAVAGVATFAGCSIDKVGSYTLTAMDGTLTNAVSGTVAISAGAAAALAFAQEPSNAAGGSTISPAITVKILDRFGNQTSSTASVDIAIGTNPSGGALSGTHPQTAIAGVATFSNLSVNKSGTGYTLSASASGMTGAISSSFTVTVGPAARLTFSQQPSDSTGATAFAAQPKVMVQDAGGNTVTSNASAVTLAITASTGTAGAVLTCAGNPTNAVSGVATFGGCAIDKSGNAYTLTATDGTLTSTTSTAFTIAVGPAAKLAFSQQPTNSTGGTAFATQPKVTVQDAGGNTVATDSSPVTLAITLGTGTAGASLTCTSNPTNAVSGVASFAGCAIDKASASSYALTATDGSLTLAGSASFSIGVGTPAKLAFTTSPGDALTNTDFATQPVVTVVDVGGNTVTTASNSITLSITSGTGASGAALSCTANTKNAANGVDTFAGCKINLAGSAYTLTAASSGLTSTASTSFNVFAPLAPTALTIANGPSGTAGKAEGGDIITIAWNEAIQLSSVCSGWTSPTASVTGVTVTMSRGNGNMTNDLSVTGGINCTGGINVGSFKASTGSYEPNNSTDTWTNSTVTWNAAASQLIITLGGTNSAPGTVNSSTYVYTPDAAIAKSGSPGIMATGTATAGPTKNF